jgi:hypothetical protein
MKKSRPMPGLATAFSAKCCWDHRNDGGYGYGRLAAGPSQRTRIIGDEDPVLALAVGEEEEEVGEEIESREEVEFVVPLETTTTTGGVRGSGRMGVRSDLEGAFITPFFGASALITIPTA